MKIIYLLLCVFSYTAAKVYPRVGVNNAFDGVEGVIYEVPEYEDPEVSLFKLIAKGIMPVITIRDAFTASKDLSNKDEKPHYQTEDIKQGLEAVIIQLQEAKNKLENGNNRIYLDIDKSVLLLEKLKHHLYLDLHTTTASSKQTPLSDDVTGESSDKVSAKKYTLLKTSMKKFLAPADSIYKYLPFDIPSSRPLLSGNDAEFSFDSEALVPYSLPKSSIEKSSADDVPGKQSFDSISFKDLDSSPVTEQPLTFEATTEQPLTFDNTFKYQILMTEQPPLERIPIEKEVQQTHVIDDVSSAETDKVEEEDKTSMRKKLSWELSSTF